MNILVIDDEKDIRENICSILLKKGYEAAATDNVRDAEAMILKNKWDLVISDIMIPHLGGFELVELVKKTDPSLPVIVVTGMDDEVLKATRTKADIILTKPFSSQQLLNAVTKLTTVKV